MFYQVEKLSTKSRDLRGISDSRARRSSKIEKSKSKRKKLEVKFQSQDKPLSSSKGKMKFSKIEAL